MSRFADLEFVVTDPALSAVGVRRSLDPRDRKKVRPERVGPVDVLTHMPSWITVAVRSADDDCPQLRRCRRRLLTTALLRTLIALSGCSILEWWGLVSTNEGTPDNGGPTAPADLDKPFAAQQSSHAVSSTNRDSVPLGELLVRR